MSDVLKVISIVLFWIVVPIIMFSLIVFGKIIGHKLKDKQKKISANAGWWAGLILFVFFFIYHAPLISRPQISLATTTISLSIPFGIGGAIIGMVILWLLKSLIQKRAVGILTLILSSTGAISLFSYFLIRNINNLLLSSILGLAFGTLFHLVIFPESAHDLFSE